MICVTKSYQLISKYRGTQQVHRAWFLESRELFALVSKPKASTRLHTAFNQSTITFN